MSEEEDPAAAQAADDATDATDEANQATIQAEIVQSNEMIDNANKAAERMENANKELKGLLAKQEAMKVEETLSGTAAAGKPTQTKEEKADKEARKLVEGTGFEDDLFPKKTT